MGQMVKMEQFKDSWKPLICLVGAGVLASANAMDKIMTKYLLQTVGIPQVPFVPVLRSDWKGNPKESL